MLSVIGQGSLITSLTEEMTAVRETAASDNCGGTSLADILQVALPADSSNAGQENIAPAAPHGIDMQTMVRLMIVVFSL